MGKGIPYLWKGDTIGILGYRNVLQLRFHVQYFEFKSKECYWSALF